MRRLYRAGHLNARAIHEALPGSQLGSVAATLSLMRREGVVPAIERSTLGRGETRVPCAPVTEELRNQLRAAAEQRHLSLSSFVRELLAVAVGAADRLLPR